MRLLVTGSTGFVGATVSRIGFQNGHEIVAPNRTMLTQSENLHRAFESADCVINCIGDLSPSTANGLNSSNEANENIPARLYEIARAAGVRLFVHISSVAAVRSVTPPHVAIDDSADETPETDYGRSKLNGDNRLEAHKSRVAGLCILRPPILYGPGHKGAFALLCRAARAGIPLPIASLENRRNFMFVDNFAYAVLAACETSLQGKFIVVDHPARTPGRIYNALTQAIQNRRQAFPFPSRAVDLAARLLLGKRSESLTGWSCYDDSRFRASSGYKPPIGFDKAIEITMRSHG